MAGIVWVVVFVGGEVEAVIGDRHLPRCRREGFGCYLGCCCSETGWVEW